MIIEKDEPESTDAEIGAENNRTSQPLAMEPTAHRMKVEAGVITRIFVN